MKFRSFLVAALALTSSAVLPAFAQDPAAQTPATKVIAVDSPAFVFSPGNWSGDAGRGGSVYRQTWNPGAYFRVSWSSATSDATLLLDTSSLDPGYSAPDLTINFDGFWTAHVPCASEIKVRPLRGSGNHVLTVYLSSSEQRDRWGSASSGSKNVVRVTGLRVDADAKPAPAQPKEPWALIIGDSITEGIATDNGHPDSLADYSYLVGQALQTQGMEYGVSACGWSGWLNPGDNPPGDIPGYYIIKGSTQGQGGTYDPSSRWDKLDAQHSLLDSKGHLSAYGEVGQEPSVITLNYMTNDILHNADASDTVASVTQGLGALRKAAPNAKIFVIIPFGQFGVDKLHDGMTAYFKTHRKEKNLFVIDLGADVARSLSSGGYWGDLHPNGRAHAVFAARILAAMEVKMAGK